MMRFLQSTFFVITMFLLLAGCDREEEVFEQRVGLKEFIPRYNKYIKNWLAEQLAGVEEKIAKEQALLEKAGDEAERKYHEGQLSDLANEKERLLYRQSIGDYFSYKSIEDLPEGLVWENGMDQPEIGDPEAKKGGAFRFYLDKFSYPATLREIGPDASGGIRTELYDFVQMGMVQIHPITGGIMPGVAKEWAEGPDGRTVFYRLDPEAHYSDGSPLQAEDFFRAIWIRASDNITDPYGKQYVREQLAQIAIYDEHTVSMSLPAPRPLLPYYASAGRMEPAPESFFSEYGPDYEERYNWKVTPSLGAYYVKEEDVKKGVSVTMTRVKNWWGEKKKFYRYRYNPDRIVLTLVRDRPKTWELFRAGELDYFFIREPAEWYEKAEMPAVFDGYAEKRTWYNQYPRPPRALYMNTHYKPLDNLDVRIGVCHATNWQKVIDVVFRGDYERLPGFTRGFGRYDNPDIEARPFSVAKAREHFAKAGFDREGEDGILINDKGERLEVPLSYPILPIYEKMCPILKEEAKKAGMDLVLEPLEWAVLIKKLDKKEHRMILIAYASTPPLPRYFENLHSRNAYDEKGNLKLDTNNINSYANEEVDALCVAYRNAKTEEEVEELSHRLQQIMHDEALIVPGYMTPYQRIVTWRWVRWPETDVVQVAPPGFDRPFESHCFWIDEEMKKETLEAMRVGRKFPEVHQIADMYREPWKPKEEVEGEGE